MNPGTEGHGFPLAVFLSWAALGIGSAAFFLGSRNAALKRRVLPFFVIGTGVLFLGFTVVLGMPLRVVGFFSPFVALITFLNIRSVKFCDACGRTLHSQNPFSPAKFCSKCGAKLR